MKVAQGAASPAGEAHGLAGAEVTPSDPKRRIATTGLAALDRADRLVVVAETPDLPPWVYHWCRRAGRKLITRRIPATLPGHRPSPARLLAAITPLTADPVLVVRPGSAGVSTGDVTAALHDLPDDEAVLIAAADAARHLARRLVLCHGLPVSFAEHSVGLRSELDHGRRLLDVSARRLAVGIPGLAVATRLVRAHPHELVGEALESGLLVIGGPRRNVTDDLGLVACTAVCHAICPVLIVPR